MLDEGSQMELERKQGYMDAVALLELRFDVVDLLGHHIANKCKSQTLGGQEVVLERKKKAKKQS